MTNPNEVRRYKCEGYSCTMQVDSSDWVMATDYDLLLAERDALVKALKELLTDSECYCADNVAARYSCGYCLGRAALSSIKERTP